MAFEDRGIRTRAIIALGSQDIGDAMQLITDVSANIVTTNMTMADFLQAAGYALELRGVDAQGIQMPPDAAMEPITYAGMSTRQVDFDEARRQLSAFLGTEFIPTPTPEPEENAQ